MLDLNNIQMPELSQLQQSSKSHDYNNASKKRIVIKENIVPTPEFVKNNINSLQKLLTNKTKVETFLDIQRLTLNSINRNKNLQNIIKDTNILENNVALSSKYIKLYCRHYSTKKEFNLLRDVFLELVFKGQKNYTFGCSAYMKRTDDYYDINNLVFSKEKKILNHLLSYIKEPTQDNYNLYVNFYETQKEKALKHKNRNTLKAVILNKKYNTLNKSKNKTTNKIHKEIALPTSVLDNIDKELNSLSYQAQQGFLFSRGKRTFKLLSQIKSSTINGILYFDSNVSVNNGREYHIINSLPSITRKKIFSDYMHLDLNNAAVRIIRGKYPDLNLPAFDYYINNRNSVIKEMADAIYTSNFNIKLNRRATTYQECKSLAKVNILKALFGSKLYIDKDTKYSANRKKGIMFTIRNFSFIKHFIKDLNTIASTEGMNIKDLSNIFMSVETNIMTKIDNLLKTNYKGDYSSFRIHDEIIVISGLYERDTLSKLKEILNEYNMVMPELDNVILEEKHNESSNFELLYTNTPNISHLELEDGYIEIEENKEILNLFLKKPLEISPDLKNINIIMYYLYFLYTKKEFERFYKNLFKPNLGFT